MAVVGANSWRPSSFTGTSSMSPVTYVTIVFAIVLALDGIAAQHR